MHGNSVAGNDDSFVMNHFRDISDVRLKRKEQDKTKLMEQRVPSIQIDFLKAASPLSSAHGL